MTHKIALTLALSTALGMTACAVDAPPPEDFEYSFLEAMPESPQVDHTLKFKTPADSHITLGVRDSLDGLDAFDGDVSQVVLEMQGVQVATRDEDGGIAWRIISKQPLQVDLLALADGGVQDIAVGPIPAGEYVAIAVGISDSWVGEHSGRRTELELPGEALLIKHAFDLDPGASSELVVEFGVLQNMEPDGKNWITKPDVSLAVSYE